MKKTLFSILFSLALAASLAGCGGAASSTAAARAAGGGPFGCYFVSPSLGAGRGTQRPLQGLQRT